MFEREEQALLQMKERLERISESTDDRLDAAIAEAIGKGRHDRWQSRRSDRLRSRTIAAGLVLCLLCVGFVGCIRVSPAFAAFVGQFPGLSYIVGLIERDRGLQLAVENNFFQPLGISDEHDGIRLTVDGVIADDGRLNIFYTAKSVAGKPRELRTGGITLLDESRREMQGMIEYNWPDAYDKEEHVLKDQIDIHMADGKAIPDTVILQVMLAGEVDHPDTVWEIAIPIDRSIFAGTEKVVDIQQTVAVEGQKFTFTRAFIRPTKIALEVEIDPTNTKKIMGFQDLQLTNEMGEVLKTNMASVGSEKMTILFESDYFSGAKQLYLSGSEIMAVDKDKLELTVDLEKGQITKAPDNRIELKSITRGTDLITLQVTVRTWAQEHYGYTIVGQDFKDADGGVFHLAGNMEVSTGSGDFSTMTTKFSIENKPMANPLTFTIDNYPARISEPFRLQIR